MIAILAVVAAVVAEALAFYCGAEILANGYNEEETGRFAPTAVTFAVVALAGFALPRLGGELALSPRTTRIVVGVIAYLVLYGAFRLEFAGDLKLWDWGWVLDFLTAAEDTARAGSPAIFGGSMLVFAFARAIWRGGEDVELEMLPRSLGLALVVVLLFVVFGAGSERAGIIGRGAAAFFTFAVIAMALSQSALSGVTLGRLRTGEVTGALLAGTVAATILGVVIFGVIVGLIGEEIGAVIYAVVTVVAYIVLTPIAWVLVWIFDLLIPEGAFLNQLIADGSLLDGEPPEDEEPAEEEEQAAWQRLLLFALRLLGLAAVLLVVAGIIIAVIRIKRRGAELRDAEANRSSAGSLGADLAAGFRSLFNRRQTARPSQATEGIYRLYSEVLEDAELRGAERSASTTPEEYAPTLAEVYHTHLTDEITFAFEDVRYAGRDADPARVRDLQDRWEQARRPQPEV